MKIFDTNKDGLLFEIEQVPAGRHVRQMHMVCTILFTPQEEALMVEQEAAFRAQERERTQESARLDAEKQQRRDAAVVKLEALGLTVQDIRDVI